MYLTASKKTSPTLSSKRHANTDRPPPRRSRTGQHALALVCCALLGACSGGGSNSSGASPGGSAVATYTVGGTISNLISGGLVLSNGSETLAVNSGSTGFVFTTAHATGTSYAIGVQTQPTGLTCSASQATGTIGTSDVSDVQITCSDRSFTLGGTISGLNTPGLVLANNGVDLFNAPAGASSFTFALPVAYTSAYAVTVQTQPAAALCTVTPNASGSMGPGNVTNVAVSCTSTPNNWTWVGGSSTVAASGAYGTVGLAGPTNAPGARDSAATWTDGRGNFWLFGGEGYDSQGTSFPLNDLWEFNFASGQWIWVGGSNIVDAAGIYGVQGQAASTNSPGARYGASSWTDLNGNLWLFGGYTFDPAGSNVCNDLWEFSSGQWSWVSGSPSSTCGNGPVLGTYASLGSLDPGNLPGARAYASSWTDGSGNLWLFGGFGYDSVTSGDLNDLWMFDVASKQWKWVSGTSTCANTAGTYGLTTGTTGVPSSRDSATAWSDASGNLWLFGGQGNDSVGASGYLNDLWKFNVGTGWTWVSGSATVNAASVGTLGAPAASGNTPGARRGSASWIDSGGNLRLFGGEDASTSVIAEFWTFNPNTTLWAWVSGSNALNSAGSYGAQGVAAATNAPGARSDAAAWVDSSGNLWLFGGYGADSVPNLDDMNDLWRYQP